MSGADRRKPLVPTDRCSGGKSCDDERRTAEPFEKGRDRDSDRLRVRACIFAAHRGWHSACAGGEWGKEAGASAAASRASKVSGVCPGHNASLHSALKISEAPALHRPAAHRGARPRDGRNSMHGDVRSAGVRSLCGDPLRRPRPAAGDHHCRHAKVRRLVCSRCGSRKVTIGGDWGQYRPHGGGWSG